MPKSKSRVTNTVKKTVKRIKKTSDAIHNTTAQLEGAFYQYNPFNFPANQGWSGSAEISQADTIFYNLRYYLVSNFRQILSQAYVEIGLVQSICDIPVDDALRGGIEVKSKQLDEKEIEELMVAIDRDNDLNIAGQAQKWARLFGGAGIIIFVDDQDPEEEFDIESINKDTVVEFRAVDMWELFWDKQNTDAFDPATQTHDYEFYTYYGTKIHKSRVMKIKGLEAPSFVRPRLRGWGVSVVEQLIRSINQYLKATDLGFEVLDEFKIDVYKIKGYATSLLKPGGQESAQRRIQAANYQKDYQNALVMDVEDDWDHKQLNFAGLAETMEGIRMQVAADMRMPITKLFGTSASGGIGNTDQNDLENYNSMVESQVRSKIKYDILRIIEIKCQMLFGMVPDDLQISFKPLRVLSAEQEENVKTQKFNRLLQAKSANEISTYEFREACNKGDLFDVYLDNAGETLNPDDPQVEAIVEKEADVSKDGSPNGQGGEGSGGDQKQNQASQRDKGLRNYSSYHKKMMNDPEFKEADHPRADDGKFGSGGGASSSEKKTSPTESPSSDTKSEEDKPKAKRKRTTPAAKKERKPRTKRTLSYSLDKVTPEDRKRLAGKNYKPDAIKGSPTPKEALAIIDYSGEDFGDFIEADRGKGEDFEQNKDLNKFLKRAPKYQGDIHRGITLGKPELNSFFKQFEEGKDVTLPAKSSFSMDKKVAKKNGAGGHDHTNSKFGVIMTIENSSCGVDIAALSDFPREKEVLVPKNCKFRVVSIHRVGRNEYHVTLSDKPEKKKKSSNSLLDYAKKMFVNEEEDSDQEEEENLYQDEDGSYYYYEEEEDEEEEEEEPSDQDNDIVSDAFSGRMGKPLQPKKSNSSQFDKASYEADGGDAWINPDRLRLIREVSHDKPDLWAQAKAESQKIYGKDNLAFMAWIYQKQGGRL